MKHKKLEAQQNLSIEMQLNGVTLLSSNQILSTADTMKQKQTPRINFCLQSYM